MNTTRIGGTKKKKNTWRT